jgi:hypothetical protein
VSALDTELELRAYEAALYLNAPLQWVSGVSASLKKPCLNYSESLVQISCRATHL